MPGDASGTVHVAVGVVEDGQGRVLIARRRADSHQGGKWEFPGGKVEPREDVVAALRRELAEEVGLVVEAAHPLIRVSHDYGDKRVVLDVHRVTAFRGRARGLEGQPLEWVPVANLHCYDFPVANRPIAAVLALPRTCLVTPQRPDDDAFLAGVGKALDRGTRFLQLRRPDLSRSELLALAGRVSPLCRAAGALLAVNGPPDLVRQAGADACHLSGRVASGCRSGRRPVPRSIYLGVSCHDSAEIAHALSLEADYLFVSPVRTTPTHPDAPVLGWDGLESLIRAVPVPVYALGGIGPAELDTARRHGAHGVAAIRALWPAD